MRILAVLAVLASCSKGDPATCRTDADALGKLLATADTTRGVETTHVTLVDRPELPRTKDSHAQVIELGPTGAWRQGAAATEPPDEAARLLPKRGEHARLPNELQLAIDGATPWREVVATLQSIRDAGFTSVILVFRRPRDAAMVAPPRTPIDAELDELWKREPSDRATAFARRIEQLVADCTAVTSLFGAVASDPGESKEQTIIRGLGPALIECGCKTDIPALRSVMWRLLANQHPTTSLALTFTDATTPLGLPGTTPWREASMKLVRDTSASGFVVTP